MNHYFQNCYFNSCKLLLYYYHVFKQTRKTVGIRFKDSFDDNRLYHVEELLAMYLEYVRGLCAADAPNEAVKDVVLTIPSYWTQWEKQAIIDAAELAGFNVLSLLNENSAAIIQYGVDLKLEPNETQSLVVYNMGSRDIEATLVKFSAYVKSTGKKTNTTVTQAEIISHESDPHLGGVNFENIIVQFLLKKAQAMFPDIAVHKNSRIMSKLRGSAEKAKMVLSANMETPIYIENLLNDKDLRAVLTRAEFLTLSEPLLNKVTKPLEALCTEFAIDASTMDLLVIGGGTRIPAIQERLKAFIGGRDLRMNLDSDEAIALGSVFRAANQSTAFQVRKFGFSDVLQYPVDVHIYDSDYDFKNVALSGLEPDESVLNKHAELFRRHNKLNKKKTVTLNHKADFGVNLAYSAVKGPQTPYPLINEYFVDGLSDFTKKYANLTVDQVPKVSLSFLLDESGMVSLVRGVATLEEQVKVPKAKPALVKKEAASEASVESETGAEDSAVATEKVAEDVEKTAESADTEQQEFEMVTKTHSGELKVFILLNVQKFVQEKQKRGWRLERVR
jgi:hypoxia up-regulated 1